MAFTKVRFWRVVELLTRRLVRVARLPVRVPMVAEFEKRLVVEAVVAKRVVVVALVVVDLSATKPPVKVEEAVEMKPLKKPRVVEVETPQDCTVQAKEPAPPSSTSQPNRPPLQVR